MFNFPFNDPQLISLLMQYGTDVVKAVFGVVIAFLYARQRRLKDMLDRAQDDIAFLLRVETLHCDLHRESFDESFKHRVRRSVEAEGLSWSGLFTPGRVRYRSFRSQFGRWSVVRYLSGADKASGPNG